MKVIILLTLCATGLFMAIPTQAGTTTDIVKRNETTAFAPDVLTL